MQASKRKTKNPLQNKMKKIKVINEHWSLSLVCVCFYLQPTLPALRRDRKALRVATAWIRAGKGLRALEEAGRASERRDLQVRWQKVLNKCRISFSFYFSLLRVCARLACRGKVKLILMLSPILGGLSQRKHLRQPLWKGYNIGWYFRSYRKFLILPCLWDCHL